MYIKLNKITLYVNFKNRICNHTHYTNRGAYLYIYTKNNITYHSIDKKYTAIIFTTTQIHMENKTIYYSINKKQINANQPIAKTKQ